MKNEKIKWEEMSNDEYITTIKNRIFRLKLGARGVLGIGKAYYLSTKTKDESEFKSIHGIVISSDNHGLQIDKRLPDDFKSWENYSMQPIFKIAETYFKMY